MAKKSTRGDLTTSKLLTMIRTAATFSEAIAIHDTMEEPSFSEFLYSLMSQRGLTPKELIGLTRIERSYFYHILNGNKRPGRNMVLRIGLCLGSSLAEMNQLLRLAGLSGLYARVRRDAVLIYAVQNHMSMDEANNLLRTSGELPLIAGK